MGCDIQLHTEIKIDGKWEHYSQPRIKRSYELFNIMAGIRGGINSPEPISQPKGLPNDLSITTKFCYDLEEDDAHSMSWFNAEEISKLCDWYNIKPIISSIEYDVLGYFFGNGWDQFHKWPEEVPEGIEDVRFVFWFDN